MCYCCPHLYIHLGEKVACTTVSPHLNIQLGEKVACATVCPHLYIQLAEMAACAVILPCQLFQHGVCHAFRITMAESYPDTELFIHTTHILPVLTLDRMPTMTMRVSSDQGHLLATKAPP